MYFQKNKKIKDQKSTPKKINKYDNYGFDTSAHKDIVYGVRNSMEKNLIRPHMSVSTNNLYKSNNEIMQANILSSQKSKYEEPDNQFLNNRQFGKRSSSHKKIRGSDNNSSKQLSTNHNFHPMDNYRNEQNISNVDYYSINEHDFQTTQVRYNSPQYCGPSNSGRYSNRLRPKNKYGESMSNYNSSNQQYKHDMDSASKKLLKEAV